MQSRENIWEGSTWYFSSPSLFIVKHGTESIFWDITWHIKNWMNNHLALIFLYKSWWLRLDSNLQDSSCQACVYSNERLGLPRHLDHFNISSGISGVRSFRCKYFFHLTSFYQFSCLHFWFVTSQLPNLAVLGCKICSHLFCQARQQGYSHTWHVQQ